MAKRCPACNADNRDDARVCEYCGTKFPASDPGTAETPERARFCSSCGKNLLPDAPFCRFCGAKVNGPASPAQTPRQDPAPARRTPASQGMPAYMQPGYQQRVRAERQATQNAAKTKKSTRGLSVILSLLLVAQVCVAAFKYPGFLRDIIGTTGTEGEDFLTVELTESDFIVNEDPQDSASAYVSGISSIVFDTAGALSAEDRTVGPDAPEAAFSNGVSVSFGDFCLYEDSHVLTVTSLGQQSDGDYTAVGYDLRLDGGEAQFDGVVQVTLPYDPSWGSNVFVQYYNENAESWEILYAEPDGSGNVTFYTDHFCEFALFKYMAEHGYGDSSEDTLTIKNYQGDAKLRYVEVNWPALAAKVRDGKLKNDAKLTALTSKGDPYSTENIMKTCGNVTGHLDFLASAAKIPGLSEKVLGPLGHAITISNFLYQGHVHGWDKAFNDNMESLGMLVVSSGSALPPPVGTVCRVVAGGYYLYKTTDSVVKYIKFDGCSDEAENIYRKFTRNQIQYDRERGICVYHPGSVKYYALPCGEKESQLQMWKVVFEDAAALEQNGVMKASEYVERIITRYVDMFWDLPTKQLQSFLGTVKIPGPRDQYKYKQNMKNDLCAWLKPYIEAQMEREYFNTLNAVWSYYNEFQDEMNTIYAVELIDPEHEYFTESEYHNHPIGIGVDENAKPSFVNEWDDLSKNCRIVFTVARWAEEGCPTYLRILGKKGDVWNYDYTFYNKKLTFTPNKAVFVTLPTKQEREALNKDKKEKESEPEQDNTRYVWSLRTIKARPTITPQKNSKGEDVQRYFLDFKVTAGALNATLIEDSSGAGGAKRDQVPETIKTYTIRLPGQFPEGSMSFTIIADYDIGENFGLPDRNFGNMYYGVDIEGKFVDDPDSDDPDDHVHAGQEIPASWQKIDGFPASVYKVEPIPEAAKGDTFQIEIVGGVFKNTVICLTYEAIPIFSIGDATFELDVDYDTRWMVSFQ